MLVQTNGVIRSTKQPKRHESKERLLAVDDSSLVIDLIKFSLRSYPIHIISVPKPESALTLLEHEPFSMVITDIKMPTMNGIDFLKKMREIPAHKDTPVLVMSGYEEQSYIGAAFAAGATGFIGKPFTSDELLEFVTHQMQKIAGKTPAEPVQPPKLQ